MSRTAAQDSILRLSMGMMAADTRVVLPHELRAWIIARVQDPTTPLTEAERTGLCDPLLAYITAYHPRILDVVAKQFTRSDVEEDSQATRHARPANHYGLVVDKPSKGDSHE